MNSVLCVGTPPTFGTLDGVWGSVGYISQHLDRDQVDTPELCSNNEKNKNRMSLTDASLEGILHAKLYRRMHSLKV
jgi:hypothetical protein